MSLTTDPNDPRIKRYTGEDEEPGPQNEVYLVLSEEERNKGYVRPYRDSYKHVGPLGPAHPLRDLSPEEVDRFKGVGYVKFEAYPEGSHGDATGRYWTQVQLDAVGNGCSVVTTMGYELSATYARNPLFYGATYCCGCRKHLAVAEFIWTADGARVGS